MMPLSWIMVFFPWMGAVILLALPKLRIAAAVNIGCASISFLLALALFTMPHGEQGWTRIDALNLPFVLLASFVALTTAIFSAAVLAAEGFDHRRIRAYHGAFQAFLAAQYLRLLSAIPAVPSVAI